MEIFDEMTLPQLELMQRKIKALVAAKKTAVQVEVHNKCNQDLHFILSSCANAHEEETMPIFSQDATQIQVVAAGKSFKFKPKSEWFLTVARLKSTGQYAVHIYRRKLMGEMFIMLDEDKNESDIRSAIFLDEFGPQISAERGDSSSTPNSNYVQDQIGWARIAVILGLVDRTSVKRKVLVVNDSDVPLVFIISTDPFAHEIEEGKVTVGRDGVDVDMHLAHKPMQHQTSTVPPKDKTEFNCRTEHAYITVARRKSDGSFAVYRHLKEVEMGTTYTVTNGKIGYPDFQDSDVRPSTFLEKFG